MSKGFWFQEMHSGSSGLILGVSRLIFSHESRYQKIEIFENDFFGRVLVLDGYVMTTERDEFIYHEALVHPAMLVHPNPQEVLIIGGGDGGALREVLRYPVRKAVLVEIDQAVVDSAKAYLPKLSLGFSDPRALALYEDGFEFMRRTPPESYDVIIVDSPDPVGSAKSLFTKEFYREAQKVLSKPGALVVQAESPFYHMETIKDMKRSLLAVFGEVNFYTSPAPSYPGGWWCYALCLKGIDGLEPKREPPEGLRYYNHRVHRAGFALPEFLRKDLM
ncbi:MAG: polyamine aminopropyltransferase [candidate division WOR-3 bacterium]